MKKVLRLLHFVFVTIFIPKKKMDQHQLYSLFDSRWSEFKSAIKLLSIKDDKLVICREWKNEMIVQYASSIKYRLLKMNFDHDKRLMLIKSFEIEIVGSAHCSIPKISNIEDEIEIIIMEDGAVSIGGNSHGILDMELLANNYIKSINPSILV